MTPPLPFRSVPLRFAHGRIPCRPFLVGPAMIAQAAGDGGGPARWSMPVRPGTDLLPAALSGGLRSVCGPDACGPPRIRLAAAIAVPGDFCGHGAFERPTRSADRSRWTSRGRRTVADARRWLYGWALAYRFPGSLGPALVDPNDEWPELPAFYESPAELIDRIDHLESRGIQTRPVAILSQPEDFTAAPQAGGPRRNRFFPDITLPSRHSGP